MATKLVTGNIVVKSIKESMDSVSTGNKTELKIRCTGAIYLGEDAMADIENFTFKGAPDDVRNVMTLLNLDTIDESTKIEIKKNMQTRLDESE